MVALVLSDNDKKMSRVVLKFLRATKLPNSATAFAEELRQVYNFDLTGGVQTSAGEQKIMNVKETKNESFTGASGAVAHKGGSTSIAQQPRQKKIGAGSRGPKRKSAIDDSDSSDSDSDSSESSSSFDSDYPSSKSKPLRTAKKVVIQTNQPKKKVDDADVSTSVSANDKSKLRAEWAKKLAAIRDNGDESSNRDDSNSSATSVSLSPVKIRAKQSIEDVASIRAQWQTKLAAMRTEGSSSSSSCSSSDDSDSSSSDGALPRANNAHANKWIDRRQFISPGEEDESSSTNDDGPLQLSNMKGALARLSRLRSQDSMSESSENDDISSSGEAENTTKNAFQARSKRKAKQEQQKKGAVKSAFNTSSNPLLRSVSFSDDDTVKEIPRVDQSRKRDLFYDRNDIRRFTVEESTRRQQEQIQRMEAMISAFSIK